MDDHHNIFEERQEFVDTNLAASPSPDDLFSLLESLDAEFPLPPPPTTTYPMAGESAFGLKESSEEIAGLLQDLVEETDQFEVANNDGSPPKSKRQKVTTNGGCGSRVSCSDDSSQDGQQRISHITVERNRRKQMNEHLAVLRSLMPCFYVKRGDQASIIGGVVDYINELQTILQSLEAKKQRKVYSEAVLSPRPSSVLSPRPSPPVLSPRKPPLSPRLSVPISPRTPQPSSPYKPMMHQPHLSTTATTPSPTSSSTSSLETGIINNELVANSKSAAAEVEVKFSGANVLLKTTSTRIPGQALKIIAALEDLALEILHVSIGSLDEMTAVNSFTIKIGLECQLSAEELAQHIQQTFC